MSERRYKDARQIQNYGSYAKRTCCKKKAEGVV
jgi:hypothetical protein